MGNKIAIELSSRFGDRLPSSAGFKECRSTGESGQETRSMSSTAISEKVAGALDRFRIEIPSWGFANTGTRFGKFIQPGAATSLEEKFADAGEVNRLTGCTPTVALHVLWDMPNGA